MKAYRGMELFRRPDWRRRILRCLLGEQQPPCFRKGADNDVWYKWGNGHDWNPSGGRWKPLGKKILGRPAAVAWSEDRLDVLVQGTDKAVWHKACDGHRWQDWESLGGQIIGRPSVVSWGPNRLDVFVRGLDNGLHQKALLGAQWYPSQLGWYSLGGGISDVPSTVSWGPGRLDVFVIGLDGVSIYHKWYAEGWSGFTPLGGNALTGPRAVTAKENSLDVVIQGRDRSVWHRSWNGRAWVPAAAWRSFDGIVDGISRYSVPEARFSSRSLAAGETVTCCTGTEKYVS